MATEERKKRPEDMALEVGAQALHEGRRGSYDEVTRYKASFLDPDTGVFREMYLERRPCPVCDADAEAFLWNKGGGRYVKCRECAMCYLNPVFTDSALADFYRNNNTAQSESVARESEFFRRIFTKVISPR